MVRKLAAASLMVAAVAAFAAPSAEARGWTYTGPHGATVTHWGWGPGPRYWGRAPCCYAGGVVAGLAVGAAVGVVAATRPVLPPPVVYGPPPVAYAPPVIYAPGTYYYVP